MRARTVKQLALGWLICSTLMTAIVMADGFIDGHEQPINIPAGDLTTSLELLAKQTGVEFVYERQYHAQSGSPQVAPRHEFDADRA